MRKSEIGAEERHGGAGGVGRGLLAAGLATLAALALASPALAAGRPQANTGGARDVSYATATLAGSVNPNGAATSYYFQYGVTRAYGAQSTIASAGGGVRSVRVALAVSGLAPLTVYHYRLVAVNGVGASIGSDRTFTTTRVPLSLAILATPDPVLFGGAVTVQGTLSGTGNGGRPVVLQADTFPYTAGFVDVGNTELTTAAGGFSFPVVALGTVTQFRVVTQTRPPVVSPVTLENVAVRVAAHARRVRGRHRVRFFGTVTPAEPGMKVAILRISHGGGVLAGGTVLKSLNAASSRFSRTIRVHRGVYRVLVQVTSGAQVSNYSEPLLIG